jgi:hypothetical protein
MAATNQPDLSPAPGIIPEPAYVTSDAIPMTAVTEKRDRPKSGRRNPVMTAIATVASALRGDKYMVDAYPTAGHEHAAPSDDAEPHGASAEPGASSA